MTCKSEKLPRISVKAKRKVLYMKNRLYNNLFIHQDKNAINNTFLMLNVHHIKQNINQNVLRIEHFVLSLHPEIQ